MFNFHFWRQWLSFVFQIYYWTIGNCSLMMAYVLCLNYSQLLYIVVSNKFVLLVFRHIDVYPTSFSIYTWFWGFICFFSTGIFIFYGFSLWSRATAKNTWCKNSNNIVRFYNLITLIFDLCLFIIIDKIKMFQSKSIVYICIILSCVTVTCYGNTKSKRLLVDDIDIQQLANDVDTLKQTVQGQHNQIQSLLSLLSAKGIVVIDFLFVCLFVCVINGILYLNLLYIKRFTNFCMNSI